MIPMLNAMRKYGYTSPYGPIVFACLVFLSAWLFAANSYSYYMGAPNAIFLVPFTIIFFFLCVVVFVFGLRTSRLMNPGKWTRHIPAISMESPFRYICIPTAVGTALRVVLNAPNPRQPLVSPLVMRFSIPRKWLSRTDARPFCELPEGH